MDIRFDGKIALVTGAGQGIGRAIAKRLSECGAQVYAVSKTQVNLDSLKQEVPNIKAVCVDLSDWNATRKAIEQVGSVDLLVNNAGITTLQSFIDITPDQFDALYAVNVKGVINVSQVIVKGMIARASGGAIVNISSAASTDPLKDHTVYCSAKASLDMISKVMALELGYHKIRVNTVNPTVVYTTMGKLAWSDPAKAAPMLNHIPLGRFAEEEDVVNAVLFLLSDKSAMIHGESLRVDGGYAVM